MKRVCLEIFFFLGGCAVSLFLVSLDARGAAPLCSGTQFLVPLTATDIPVGTTNLDSGSSSDVAMDGADRYLVVWEEVDPVTGNDVLGQFFDPAGVQLEAAFPLASDPSDNSVPRMGTQTDPFVAMHPNGEFAAVWRDGDGTAGEPSADGDGHGVTIRFFDEDGLPMGPQAVVNTNQTNGNQGTGRVEVRPDGGYVVTWTDFMGDGTGSDVFARVYDAFLAPLAVFNLNEEILPDSQGNSAVAVDEAGGMFFVWSDSFAGGRPTDVSARPYADDAMPIASQFVLNTTDSNDQQSADATYLANGMVIGVWEDFSDGVDRTVSGRILDLEEPNFDPEAPPLDFPVSSVPTEGPGGGIDPVVAARPTGDFFVVWTDHSDLDGSGAGIVARRFGQNGNPIGVECVVNLGNVGDQTRPRVAGDDQSRIVVTWTSDDGAGGTQVLSRVFKRPPICGLGVELSILLLLFRVTRTLRASLGSRGLFGRF